MSTILKRKPTEESCTEKGKGEKKEDLSLFFFLFSPGRKDRPSKIPHSLLFPREKRDAMEHVTTSESVR